MKTWSRKSLRLEKSLGERMILICIVLMSVGFYTSCKTIKQSNTTEVKAKTAANLELNQSSDAKLNINQSIETNQSITSSLNTTDKGTSSENVEETSTNTKLSPPDSTGKQYPTETTTTNRKIKRGKNNNSTANADSKKDIKSKATNEDKSKLKANSALTDKSKTQADAKEVSKQSEEVKTPTWVSVSIAVSIVALLSFIYLILKRYNLIK